MEKHCPKCRASNKSDAKFCRKCGYHFATQHPEKQLEPSKKTVQTRENIRQSNSNNNKLLVAIIIVLLIVIAGFILYEVNSKEKSNSNSNQTTSSRTQSRSSSSISDNSNGEKSSSHNYELSSGNNPKLDAAALIYYVAKNDISDSSIDSNGYIVKIPSDSSLLDSLSKKGQNQVYEVYREENRNDGGPVFLYTIDSDDTINIYRESENEGFDSDKVYDPVKSISKNDIMDYLNNRNMGSAVKDLSDQVEIQQTGSD